MHAVIFEVFPRPERVREYLDLAAALRPELERIDGFLSVERFASAQAEGKILSFSLWRDEAAVVRWRSHGGHRAVQAKARAEIFRDYRLRVAEVVRTLDAAGPGADNAPGESAPAAAQRPCTVVLELDPGASSGSDTARGWDFAEEHRRGLLAWEGFASLYTEGRRLVLTSWADVAPARAWMERTAAAAGSGHRLHLMAVERDYGMFDRAGAPLPS